jgi:hypothetical protein
MPTNLIITYNRVLELLYDTMSKNVASLRGVFNRDFGQAPAPLFLKAPVHPTPAEGQDALGRLFHHLTTVVTDERTKKREFESERAIRIHWIRYHLELQCPTKPLVFKVEDESRIYILDQTERYVIVLEPLKRVQAYYLLTAYRLEPGNYKKIMKKYEKRGTLL